MTIKESYMSAVTSELTTAELEGQVGELLPAREEMRFTFNRRVSINNIGRQSGNTFAEGQVVFGSATTNVNITTNILRIEN